jgi:hypothetical protein
MFSMVSSLSIFPSGISDFGTVVAVRQRLYTARRGRPQPRGASRIRFGNLESSQTQELSTFHAKLFHGENAEQTMRKLIASLTKPSSEAYRMFIMTTDSFALLRARRREIADEAKDLRSRLESLEAEDTELESAEKVLLRFGAVPSEPIARPASDFSGKPEGTPTTPSMILALLREAGGQGKPGLEPKELQISISKRWWPTVKSEDVGPTAWRMWKDGRLKKAGSLYMLPNSSAAADLLGEDPAAAD